MQPKQILMYNSREDLYHWLVNSDLAMNEEELKNNEKKTNVILAPNKNAKTYEDFVNSFSCDNLQTLAWYAPSEVKGENPKVSVIPIHIMSMQYTPCEDEDKDVNEEPPLKDFL